MTPPLSRRERQLLDVLYRLGHGTVNEVRDAMTDAPSYSSVRTLLRVMEDKGHLRHEQDGPRYVYMPTTPKAQAGRKALEHLVQTFFGGSPGRLVSSLLADSDLDETTLAELERLAEQTRDQEVE